MVGGSESGRQVPNWTSVPIRALGEVLRTRVGLAFEDGDVNVARALVLSVLARALDSKSQARDRPVGGGPQFGVGGEAAGEGDYYWPGPVVVIAGVGIPELVGVARMRG